MRLRQIWIKFIPPILRDIYYEFRNRNSNPPISRTELNQISDKLPPELVVEVNHFLSSQSFLETSKYWKNLILRHLRMISKIGFDNWGNSVALNYFTWNRLNNSELRNLSLTSLSNEGVLKIHDGFTPVESYSHNIITLLLYEYLKSKKDFDFSEFKRLSKLYNQGNTPTVEVEGVFITQDLLNSAIEYSNFSITLPMNKQNILEIGSGSGRVADYLLSRESVNKYVIIDIPPATFIARTRLKHSHPKLIIKNCLTLESFNKSFEKSDWDVLFLPPDLAEFLPDKFFNVTLAIDCLHEMNFATRLKYSQLAERKSQSFYVKIWENAFIPVDKEYLDAKNFEIYGFQRNWKVVYDNSSVFPANFKEYLFSFNDI